MMNNESVVLARDVPAILIPDGLPVILKRGEAAHITQLLGGKFTVQSVQGQLFRIEGRDADALGQPVPEAAGVVPHGSDKPVQEQVWDALRTCYDPEIPVSVVELGLIYGCDVVQLQDDSYRVQIRMTLTAPGCGMGEVLQHDIETAVISVPRVSTADIELVFNPPWDQNRMSEAARLQLGML
ncbi:MAG: putative Fe-S cluster assembly protein SufT [Myxococcota bacterium]